MVVDVYNKTAKSDVFPTILLNVDFGNSKYVIVETDEKAESNTAD